MKNIGIVCFAFCCSVALQSCGESRFAQWGNKKLNDLYYRNERALDDTEYKLRQAEKAEKARKRLERQQMKKIPEGLRKYVKSKE